MEDLAGIRKDYSQASLDIDTVHSDPVRQFEDWLSEALDAGVPEASAMALASVDQEGRPSVRMMLLKGIEDRKFIFFSNYKSQKGRELQKNPACSALFFWPALERQVRIEGVATLLDKHGSEAYFKTRPRQSQIATWASPQSEFLQDKHALERLVQNAEDRFKSHDVLPLPPGWGGYALVPRAIEFWQGRPSRLHDRIIYTMENGSWKKGLLAP